MEAPRLRSQVPREAGPCRPLARRRSRFGSCRCPRSRTFATIVARSAFAIASSRSRAAFASRSGRSLSANARASVRYTFARERARGTVHERQLHPLQGLDGSRVVRAPPDYASADARSLQHGRDARDHAHRVLVHDLCAEPCRCTRIGRDVEHRSDRRVDAMLKPERRPSHESRPPRPASPAR